MRPASTMASSSRASPGFCLGETFASGPRFDFYFGPNCTIWRNAAGEKVAPAEALYNKAGWFKFTAGSWDANAVAWSEQYMLVSRWQQGQVNPQPWAWWGGRYHRLDAPADTPKLAPVVARYP